MLGKIAHRIKEESENGSIVSYRMAPKSTKNGTQNNQQLSILAGGEGYPKIPSKRERTFRRALGKVYRWVASFCRFLLRRSTTSTKIEQKWNRN